MTGSSQSDELEKQLGTENELVTIPPPAAGEPCDGANRPAHMEGPESALTSGLSKVGEVAISPGVSVRWLQQRDTHPMHRQENADAK